MNSVVLLVLLGSSGVWAQARLDGDTAVLTGQSKNLNAETDPKKAPKLDLYTELRELRALVMDLSIQQGVLGFRLTASEKEVAEVKADLGNTKRELGIVLAQLKASERQVEELRRKSDAQAVELADVKKRQTATDRQVQEQKATMAELINTVNGLKAVQDQQNNKLTAVVTRLEATESVVEDLRAKLTKLNAIETQVKELTRQNAAQTAELKVISAGLKATQTEIKELKTENGARPKFAFTATLGGHGTMGPVKVETTLVYRNVLTNIGNAYNQNTGIFRAPVRGAYYFRFTTFAFGNSINFGASLYRNGHMMVSALEIQSTGDHHDYSSNGAILQLEAGDQVYMSIPGGYQLYAIGNRNSYSGYLLFPL